MNRIYLPYPLELLAKIISWVMVIAIDSIEFILAPFMRIGLKCFAAFTVVAAGFSGYTYIHNTLMPKEALLMFGAMLALFLVFICFVRVMRHFLIKVVRPPFADIVFESVAVSFRRPVCRKRVRV